MPCTPDTSVHLQVVYDQLAVSRDVSRERSQDAGGEQRREYQVHEGERGGASAQVDYGDEPATHWLLAG